MTDAPTDPPALLTPRSAAAYLSMGRSSLDRAVALGLVPAPVKVGGKVGGKVLHAREVLDVWTRHGCPTAAEFAPIWAARLSAANPAPAKRR